MLDQAGLGRREGRNQRGRVPSLNITPFMNLMVVLVPFLLSGIVFSRLAVLEMNLPTTQAAVPIVEDNKEAFRLIVTLRKRELSIVGSGIGTLRLPNKGKRYDFEQLAVLLKKMKLNYPKEVSAILLSEADMTYEALIAVMDQLRNNEEGLLFPEISIGEVKST